MSVVKGEEVVFADLPGRRSGDPLAGVDAASSVRLVRLRRSASRAAHRHPHSEEVIHVSSGTGIVYLAGARLAVGPGDTVHVPAGAEHATVPDAGVEMELICFFPHPRLDVNLEETDIDVMQQEDR